MRRMRKQKCMVDRAVGTWSDRSDPSACRFDSNTQVSDLQHVIDGIRVRRSKGGKHRVAKTIEGGDVAQRIDIDRLEELQLFAGPQPPHERVLRPRQKMCI